MSTILLHKEIDEIKFISEEKNNFPFTFESFPKCIHTVHAQNEKTAVTSHSLARKEVLHTTWRIVATCNLASLTGGDMGRLFLMFGEAGQHQQYS